MSTMQLSELVFALCINSLVHIGRDATFASGQSSHSYRAAGVSDLLLSTVSTFLHFLRNNVR
jgi:hypothetical protein